MPQSDIMIVDDNPANLKLLEDMLMGRGHDVRSFPLGRLAVASAIKHPPDLILLDINMPEMNGYEVCQRLKASGVVSSVPVIFLSALSETHDKVKAFRCGAVDYISKPFQFEEVQARVETHLELYNLQRALHLQNEHLEEAVAARTSELSVANERLSILDRSKNDFLNLISHEFRTPLNGVLGVADVILDGMSANEENQALKEVFDGSRQRLLSILDDALLLTRIDVNGGQFRSGPISLRAVLDCAIEVASPFAESRSVSFNAPSESSDRDLVLGVEDLLVSALRALLETAVKFSYPGSTVLVASDTALESHDRLVKLTFEAVDYAADVWVNGHFAGHHEGYFEPFSFYVQSFLLANEDNLLVVRVNSPNETPEAWSLHKRLIKGVLNHHDTRPGGAWSVRGQEQNTGGIWGAVTLSAPGKVDISRMRVTTRADKDDVWLAEIDLGFSHAGLTGPLRFEAQIAPDTFVTSNQPEPSIAFTLGGTAGSPAAHLQARVSNPRLWSTWDQGVPNLYRATVRAFERDQLVAESAVRFGFRSIEVDRATKQWRLNGHPIFLRGTNYISSQWLSEMTPAKLGFDLELMKHANINAIRVHAHLEADAFYAQCDEKGVLVWQDFALQWGYDDSPEFIKEASRQAVGMVDWLFNHPSIAAWTLQNEPPFDADWMQYKYRDYRPGQNKTLNAAVTQAVSNADETRWVHAYSTTGEHQWLGWYSGTWMDFAKPSKEPIVSEYGAQALPRLPALRRIFAESELWPKTDREWEKWEYHNFQRHETFDLAQVKRGENIDEWIANSQRYQAKLIQFAAENYRRQKYSPVTGIFQFLFNEDWPSINWGIVDYWRTPKPGYDALRIAYQPVLPSIAWSQESWSPGEVPSVDLWVVNDLACDYRGAILSWTLKDSQRILKSDAQQVDIAADSAKQTKSLSFSDLPEEQYSLIVTLRDAGGVVLGENSFAFAVEPSQ